VLLITLANDGPSPWLVAAAAVCVLVAALVALVSRSDVPGGEIWRATPRPVVSPSPPRDQGSNVAVEPDFALATAVVRPAVLEDDVAEKVVFCFTGRVRQAGPPALLKLLGPDVDTAVEAVAVDLLATDDRCVLARFEPGTPVAGYSVAVALDGAARDVDAASIASTAPLAETPLSTAVVDGGTSAPDLVSVVLEPTLNRVIFVYDEPLSPPLHVQGFSYYSLSGQLHVADDFVSLEDDTVVVAFTSPDDDVEDAARVVARRGAVRGRDKEAATPGVEVLRPAEGTKTPNLVQVERVGGTDTLWEFTFDEAVRDAVSSRFVLYGQDATPSFGTAVTRPRPDVVRVVIPGVDDAASEQVLAVAVPSAVRDVGIGQAGSTMGVIAIGRYDAAPGRTTGPDLLCARLDAPGGVLRLKFDEQLERRVLPSPTAVRVVLPGGQRVDATALVEVTGRQAIFLVPSEAAEVAGRVVIEAGALRGRDGEASAPGSVVPS